ncbi:DNA-processing protein DprA [Vibrio hepatarius]|jgi:DNA processing protein|uniref:DNA processing protein DprA n=1 Tax=Vibrio hepatarius TaxID=171383 RepID=A0A0M0I361_9VIBR|nr:DNA-processing protein DprA [Vibrio hepatarius]KOO08770.1 DNA processing protein DprA [Vibrio hepatarius]
MSEVELSAWLALYFTPRVGPKTFNKLTAIDEPVTFVESAPSDLLAMGFSQAQVDYLKRHSSRDVDTCLEWANASNQRHILLLNDCRYPQLLKQTLSAPAVLFVEGEVSCLAKPQLAMVGSRNASIDGLNTARSFAQELVEHQLVITSGLALGVDGYAHDGALKGGGQTVAVLGCGLNNIYPARHRGLASRIIDSGALVSEFHPTAKPKADHFPRRNRIISGLSTGVLVVEAAEKSGSLITARYAAEQGRDVFAIPSSIHHPQGRGCNVLIKQGACLVQNVSDILDEIDTLVRWSDLNKPPVQTELFEQIETKERLPFPQLLANVGSEATPVDILASRTNIPVQDVMMQLLELELEGHVVAVSGGYIRKGRG